MSISNVTDLNNDLLSLISDNYLPLEAKGRLTQVNKRFSQLVSQHPLLFLGRYILAYKNNKPLPSFEGVRWGCVSDLSKEMKKRVVKLEPGLRGFHHFLSEKHDFDASPSLERFVLLTIKKMKWIVNSLSRSAQNKKIEAIVLNFVRYFQLMDKKAVWTKDKVDAIDWNQLKYNGCVVHKFQIKTLKKITGIKLTRIKEENELTSFFGNQAFGWHLIHAIFFDEDFLKKAFILFKQEFPTISQKECEAAFDRDTKLFLMKSSYDFYAPMYNAFLEKRKVFNDIEDFFNMVEEFREEESRNYIEPKTPEEFIQAIPHFTSFKEIWTHFRHDFPFKDCPEVLLALSKRLGRVPSHFFSNRLLNNKTFLLQLAKTQLVFIHMIVPLDQQFLVNLVSINPKHIKYIDEKNEELITTALKANPWFYLYLKANEKAIYLPLFCKLLPDLSLVNHPN